jgi:hypothetical protein
MRANRKLETKSQQKMAFLSNQDKDNESSEGQTMNIGLKIKDI